MGVDETLNNQLKGSDSFLHTPACIDTHTVLTLPARYSVSMKPCLVVNFQ